MAEQVPPHAAFAELPIHSVQVDDPFWSARQQANREVAIPYQWEQLERTGTIDNFRLAAGDREGTRQGFFYSDSDAHKWAEAAANALEGGADPRLSTLLETYLDLVTRAQEDDGYLFTYNQLHFPGTRWKNLQVEHELYTLGHLIEAGVALYRATGDARLLTVARRGADLAVQVFRGASPIRTPGHQEIEIALVRLFHATGERAYLDLAARFLEGRGRTRLFGAHLAAQFVSQVRRAREVERQRRAADASGEDRRLGFDFTENLTDEEPPLLAVRANAAFLSGRYQQQHAPIRHQTVPEGHAVRWGYQSAAVAMLYQETGDTSLLDALRAAWEHMVCRRMYVTGGVGSLPMIEGFGRDWELHDRFAYCETCAALASVFWSWEMLRATGEARYADLVEWQLLNAAAVGVALDGCHYLYRNPLESPGGLTRRPWFHTACCPSNVSRTWAALGRYLFGWSAGAVWVHQYIGSEVALSGFPEAPPLTLAVRSDLPWEGRVEVEVQAQSPVDAVVHLRIPSWTSAPTVRIEGEALLAEPPERELPTTASGYVPHRSWYLPLRRRWEGRTRIALDLPMEVTLRRADPRVRTARGRVAITRGPLVYSLESCDNPGAGVPDATLDVAAGLTTGARADWLGGGPVIEARDPGGQPLTLIPYYAWANREPSAMQVWIRAHDPE